MGEHNPDQTPPDKCARKKSLSLPVWLLAALVVAFLALPGIGARYYFAGTLNVIHCLLILFFSINLLICYWEVCLFFKRDYIETRTEYWRRRQRETGRTPAIEFLAGKIPLRQVWSPTRWADVWATYSLFDGSHSDRRTFGFNADIANGFITPVPTLILYAAYTVDFLPAVVAGILGVMMFWQWTYATSVYWVSFFVAGRQRRVTRGGLYTYVGATNAPWVLFPLLGLYVSVRLILDGNYGILGH